MDATNRTSAETIKPVAMAAPIATEKPRRGIAISSSHGTAERTSSVHPTTVLYLDHDLVKARPAPPTPRPSPLGDVLPVPSAAGSPPPRSGRRWDGPPNRLAWHKQ